MPKYVFFLVTDKSVLGIIFIVLQKCLMLSALQRFHIKKVNHQSEPKINIRLKNANCKNKNNIFKSQEKGKGVPAMFQSNAHT